MAGDPRITAHWETKNTGGDKAQPQTKTIAANAIGKSSASTAVPHAPRITNLAAPTTSLTRQNSNSSLASSVAGYEDSAAMLRRTLSAATLQNGHGGPTNRPMSSASQKTPTASGILTPATTFHGSLDNSAEDSPVEDTLPEYGTMRHGFEDEYNSEAYLALLEQVGLDGDG